jgi:outer membrane protein assembly factor BamB
MPAFPVPFRALIATTTAAVVLSTGMLQAAPDDAGEDFVPPFTAKEIAQGYTDQKILAMTAEGVSAAQAASAELAGGFELDQTYSEIEGLRVIRVPASMTTGAARAALAATGLYQFVEFDYLKQTAVTPNDPSFVDGGQWHHQNTGQVGGTVGADIGSVEAWDIRTDAPTVVVAVIDSGARITHQDLAPNLWTNSREIAGNNRDDDGNGFVDDIHGIDARDDSGDPTPPVTEDHGTHVAGLVGAAGNNGVGTAGVAWQVQMMHLRFLGGTEGNGSTSDEIQCINYAIANGADVINASYGALGVEGGFNQSQLQAIRRARDAGIIFVAASGNESLNLDISRAYPASFEVDNILVVGNSTRLDDRSTASNTGSGAVDLFAPGSEIVSTAANSDTGVTTKSGTSMASPIVAGAVALLKAQFPQDNYRETMNRLLRGTREGNDFRGHAMTSGRLNVADALRTTDTRPFHDDFADRARLAGNIVKSRSSSHNATTESGESAHAGRLSRSLWYTWVAPSSGIVSVDTRGSEGDTQLAIYTGDNLSSLSLIADNDNDAAGFLSSRATFTAVVDTTYQIAVDNTAAGMVILNLVSAQANDAFDSAQLLDGDAPLVTTTNASATSEPGEPRPVSAANGKTLWYRWEAPATGTFQVSAYSATTDPALAVYTGSSVNALTTIGFNDDAGINGANINALVEFQATEGTEYHIALDSLGSESGEITLSLTDAVWQFATGDRDDSDLRRPTITNAPSVAEDGTIYVSSGDNYFYAINPDGSLKWRTQTDSFSDSSTSAIAPDGTIHFGTVTGTVYALNPNGSIKWTSTLGNSAYVAAPSMAADGTVYYKQDDGTVRAFNSAGVQQWSYFVAGEGSYAGPAITTDGTIIVPANDGAIHALSAAGNLIWKFQPQTASATDDVSGIYTSPSIDQHGNIYACTLNGTAFSITDKGELRWVFRTPETGENVSSSLALGDGRAYFASYGGFLYALDQGSGAMIWRSSIEAQARSSSAAIASDGSIIVGSYANKLFRFSSDGQQVGAWSAGNWFRSSPALANGRIYVGNGDGKVYAFDLGGVGPAPANETYPWPQYRHGAGHMGRATVEATGQVIPEDPSNPGRLVNLSVRNRTEFGAGVLTAGFVLEGDSPKELVIRGIGPTLAYFGVTGSVDSTELKVYTSTQTASPLASNAGWTSSSGDGRELGAFALTDGSDDSVLRRQFGAGGYTAQVLPATSGTAPGNALVEIYDAQIDNLSSRLINLSARTEVGANQAVTVGFVIGGTTSRSLLLRAVGPGLEEFGLTGVLGNPSITLLRDQDIESSNDDWGGNVSVRQTAEQVGAFPLEAASRDAALLATLPPGAYTARVTGEPDQSGVVLVEVYLVSN